MSCIRISVLELVPFHYGNIYETKLPLPLFAFSLPFFFGGGNAVAIVVVIIAISLVVVETVMLKLYDRMHTWVRHIHFLAHWEIKLYIAIHTSGVYYRVTTNPHSITNRHICAIYHKNIMISRTKCTTLYTILHIYMYGIEAINWKKRILWVHSLFFFLCNVPSRVRFFYYLYSYNTTSSLFFSPSYLLQFGFISWKWGKGNAM